MHGQITHETRIVYVSRCFCGWKSVEHTSELDANIAYDIHARCVAEGAGLSTDKDRR